VKRTGQQPSKKFRRISSPPPLFLGQHVDGWRARFWSWSPFAPGDVGPEKPAGRRTADAHFGCQACNTSESE